MKTPILRHHKSGRDFYLTKDYLVDLLTDKGFTIEEALKLFAKDKFTVLTIIDND